MPKPALVYDGDCGFCRRWIGRWRALTGPAVEYVPSSDAARRFPKLPRERLSEAVCLVEPDRVSWGAEAALRALSRAPRRAWLLRLYLNAPPFAACADAAYRLVARNRMFFSRVTLLLWGEDLEPPTYAGAARLLLAAVALCHLLAFVSLAPQVDGLLGARGVLPAARWMDAVRARYGGAAYGLAPSLFWLTGPDGLAAACWVGAGLSLAALAGLAQGPLFLLTWALHLSVVSIGQDFLSFQWDILLSEAGFLALFLAPWSWRPSSWRRAGPPNAAIWLFRWLLFRLMLESGIVKLASGDATWRSLTALAYHYQTQPLPTWLGWHAHQLPLWLHKASAAGMFAVELGAPWLIFLPRRPRAAAFLAFAGLQLGIAATGNYGYFNLLSAALGLSLVDDSMLRSAAPRLARRLLPPAVPAAPKPRTRAALAAAVYCGLAGAIQLAAVAGLRPNPPAPVGAALALGEPLRLVNAYGLFAVMTTTRLEISLEGTLDGTDWREYPFRWKPGRPDRRPPFVAPHMPRLDWQMWFAALGPCEASPWFRGLLYGLLSGSKDVRGLLASDPFDGESPKAVRSLLYEYRFTTRAERASSGAWWKRELKGEFCPAASLRSQPR